jgi:hypothetical protein
VRRFLDRVAWNAGPEHDLGEEEQRRASFRAALIVSVSMPASTKNRSTAR